VWELICHHTYDWHGLPIDRSAYDNHGSSFGVDVLPDGIAPGSGALRFVSGSGISVPLHPACRSLRAIRVDCTVRLTDPTPKLRTLIDCDGSFMFFIFSSGLWAVHAVQPDSPGIYFGVFGYTGFHNDGITTVMHDDAVSGQEYQIPLGQWVTLTFEHDGIAAMRLFADGQLVAQRHHVLGSIRDAGVGGIRIGSSAGGSDFLGGDIDEIKVWRHDPRTMSKEFFRRPIDRHTANCWYDFLKRIDELLRSSPECARLLSRPRDVLVRMLRVIVAHGPGAINQQARFCREYQRLWRGGRIDGPEMAGLLGAWIAWMRSLGVVPEADAELRGLLNSDCFRRMFETSPGIDCDAQFAGLMRIFIQASGSSKQTYSV
jgi:hypothetical protein